MSATMAKETQRKGGRPKSTKDRHVEPREAFHLSQELLDVLTTFVEQSRPETSKSAVIRLALEEFFERRGKWPPKKGSE
jgi:hypothetical protein